MTLILLFEQPAEAPEIGVSPYTAFGDSWPVILAGLSPDAGPLAWAWVGYASSPPAEATKGELVEGRVMDYSPMPPLPGPPQPFAKPELAFAAAVEWVLKQPGGAAPFLVLHATLGRGAGTAEVEKAAGALKTAIDLVGAPGWFCQFWVTDSVRAAFPPVLAVAQASALARSMYRLASPLGEEGVGYLSGTVAEGIGPAVRCFEAGPGLRGSVTESFLRRALVRAVLPQVPLEARIFLLPKENEGQDDCQDAVSLAAGAGRVAISDGAGTASYSAEWARALCRRAVGSPPRFPRSASQEPGDLVERTAALKTWLAGALADWEPEVPWENLMAIKEAAREYSKPVK